MGLMQEAVEIKFKMVYKTLTIKIKLLSLTPRQENLSKIKRSFFKAFSIKLILEL